MFEQEFISIFIYFVLMILIGFYAFFKNRDNAESYLLGDRNLGPAVTALSAGASDMSGWLMMGLPGAMITQGYTGFWIVFGLLMGAYGNYRIIAPRFRVFTQLTANAITISDYFERRFLNNSHYLRLISALIIIIFFTIYCASGLVAGGKLFYTAFEVNYHLGMIITASVVICYTLFGGFLAVSLTDFVQGCIIMIALVMVPLVVINDLNGWSNFTQLLNQSDFNFKEIYTGISVISIISALAWGLGYFGQPHILVRFMSIKSVKHLPSARRIGMSWMFISICGAIGVGLSGLTYLNANHQSLTDPETIFIYLSQILFHPLVYGFLLAAILAAIMSTISSQLLVCSSSLTEDFYLVFFNRQASQHQLVIVSKISVFLVAVISILLALDETTSILKLVSNAWAGFGAAFGPLIMLSLFWPKMNSATALTGMISGALTVIFAIYVPIFGNGITMSDYIYEIIPGIIASFLCMAFCHKLTGGANQQCQKQFFELQNGFLKMQNETSNSLEFQQT